MEPVLHYFRNRLVPPTRSSGRNSTRPRGFADNRGPRALRLARQRRGRDSNSRSFRIRTFQARAIDQLGDLSRNPTWGVKIKGGESEIRTHEARYQRAYSISSRALSTNSAISPNTTARLRGLEPLATRSAIWCSIQTELQAHISGGEGGIRTRGRALRPYDGLANRCLKPTRPPLHDYNLARRKQDSNPRTFRFPVFKTGAIDHSAIPPRRS